ncbi:MAG: GGDEF domain-containing protein [Patescibacteria group bacterium]
MIYSWNTAKQEGKMLPEKYHYFRIILNLWLDSQTPKEFLQAFLRQIVGPDFNADRIGIFQFSNGDIEFIFGIGDPLPNQHELLNINVQELTAVGELSVPTAGIGFDYYVRAGKFIFGFDDTLTNREFSATEKLELKEISVYLSRLLTAKIKDAGIKHAAIFDELTGLERRGQGLLRLQQLLREIREGIRSKLVVAILDIDHFKRINDKLGHAVGDHVLIHVASITKEIVEAGGGHVSRIGGEEFLILVEREDCLEKVRQTIESSPTRDNGFALNPTVSIGYVSIDTTLAGQKDIDRQVLKAADKALYAVKESGKNRTMNGNQFL